MLPGNGQIYSLLLIIGATLPLFLLLTSIAILIKTKTVFVSNTSTVVELQQRIGTSLVVVVLFACLVFGIYMLLAPQPIMLLVLRLSILAGLVLGIILGRWALTMSVQIGLYGIIFYLLISPLLIKEKLAGEKFDFMDWSLLSIPAIFLLLYGAYAFWIAQQTGSSWTAFWSTLMAALVTALIACNISPLHILIREIMSEPTKFSLVRLSILAQSYRYDCMVVMGLVLPLLLLALIGALIGSFLA